MRWRSLFTTLNHPEMLAASENTNFIYGVAIHNSGTVAINHSTFRRNSANGCMRGGGFAIYVAIHNDAIVKISNAIISGSSGTPNGGGIYNNGTPSIQNSVIASWRCNRQSGDRRRKSERQQGDQGNLATADPARLLRWKEGLRGL